MKMADDWWSPWSSWPAQAMCISFVMIVVEHGAGMALAWVDRLFGMDGHRLRAVVAVRASLVVVDGEVGVAGSRRGNDDNTCS